MFHVKRAHIDPDGTRVIDEIRLMSVGPDYSGGEMRKSVPPDNNEDTNPPNWKAIGALAALVVVLFVVVAACLAVFAPRGEDLGSPGGRMVPAPVTYGPPEIRTDLPICDDVC